MARIVMFARLLPGSRHMWMRPGYVLRNLRALWAQTEPEWLSKQAIDVSDQELDAFLCATGTHDWEYFEDAENRPYTGYLERCRRCGEIMQVVQ